MCTLSWRINAKEYELFFNRDERKTRQPATPPKLHFREGIRYLAPTDGDFGGTWLFVNTYGIAACILNRYSDTTLNHKSPCQYISRGILLSSLSTASRQEEIKESLENKKLEAYRPFTLVSFEVGQPVYKWDWNGHHLSFNGQVDHTIPITSSSYQSPEVEKARKKYFKEMLNREKEIDAAFLQRYHHSYIPGNGAYSVCMQREDAETQSLCHVHVSTFTDNICLRYAPKIFCQPKFAPMKEWALSLVKPCFNRFLND